MARRKTHRSARDYATHRLQTTWQDAKTTFKDAGRALLGADGAFAKQVAAFGRRNGLDAKRLARRADGWRSRFDREGRRARKAIEIRLGQLQQRALRDRRALARAADDAVSRTLAALNIPTRRELQQLSRRVEQLTNRVGVRRR
jgi:poly(hydroxyalkanoate) granule-associated protein